jgi:hypothetical protein
MNRGAGNAFVLVWLYLAFTQAASGNITCSVKFSKAGDTFSGQFYSKENVSLAC